eukprot:CAMPEP_0197929144 /NCGR_PEP_ID=MMETSP1439-20131203/103423_1 /TAXON_ID=66791 /ORGANISM="Gonyaulax spinifera, Strain CCMP409" /LENGTH=490 /DNA_ID=CAMNT_0043551773 /DNA_START=99 /DNA_END=1571 /DNA_ORIENTATION=+
MSPRSWVPVVGLAAAAVSAVDNTGSMKEREVAFRQLEFCAIIATCTSALAVGGILATCIRLGRLSMGPLSLTGKGIYWRGQLRYGQAEGESYDWEDDDPASVALTEAEQEELRRWEERCLEQAEKHLQNRKLVLLFLFAIYAGVSIWLPLLSHGQASCNYGFFWETHMIFLALLIVNKAAELVIYVRDDTVIGQLDFCCFMVKFVPSFVSFVDGYTDFTAVVIASSCADPFAKQLALYMAITYVVGVVIAQWVVMTAFALCDPSQAVLMKVLHMDALASCITLPDSQKPVWNALHLVRTFGEDLPQACLQTLFVWKVGHNPFMYLSVCIGIASSCKALHDAFRRALLAAGAHAKLRRGRDGVAAAGDEDGDGAAADYLDAFQEESAVIPPGFCRKGCGRPVRPGLTSHGRKFDSCCRACALGFGHDLRCEEIDPALLGPRMCKNGCGRPVNPGITRRGSPFSTCCRGCTLTGTHDSTCGRADASADDPDM